MNTDPELLEGARNAVRVCLNVGRDDRVLVTTDRDASLVGDSLLYEALATGALAEKLVLEDYGERPLRTLPSDVQARIAAFSPTVVFLAISALEGELPMRGQFADAAYAGPGVRYAHMPTVTARIMREGLRVDYQLVDKITTSIYELLCHTRHAHVTSARGSDLRVRFSETYKWVPCRGLYHRPGEGGNLPEGEVYTYPESIEGILVADVVGDYFSPKYGLLEDPVVLEIERGYARKVTCSCKDLENELFTYLNTEENSLRVGEFAIGTNVGVQALCGIMLQDEKIPGFHVALGDPSGVVTGADWSCETHVDLVPSLCTVSIDGHSLIREGAFCFQV